MKKHAVIFIALLFSFNLLAGTSFAEQSDCAAKCQPRSAKGAHGHASGATVRLMHLNCCSGNAALPCELASHQTVPRLECSFSTCRTKIPDSTNSALILRLIVAEDLAASANGLKPEKSATGKAPPLYLQNLSILC
jgi:hypothetical protein